MCNAVKHVVDHIHLRWFDASMHTNSLHCFATIYCFGNGVMYESV